MFKLSDIEVVIEPYGALPCEAAVFKIGKIEADKSDFGYNTDFHPEDAEDYACGSNRFEPHDTIPDGVLEKYNLTEAEYRELQSELESQFYVGGCGWCV